MYAVIEQLGYHSAVWMYTPSSDSWREVSSGGCSPGDTGEVVLKIFDMRKVAWLLTMLGMLFVPKVFGVTFSFESTQVLASQFWRR
jgi:hypothetical protein